ncbi:MAG TPA: uroporphyrinogen-III synthase [Gemmatimonadales bacterium]|nr:uroporphyrinogen-III synthase [Gemmatimonadales bacterium]
MITRSRVQAMTLAQALSARGAIPIFFPTIEIRPLEDCSTLDAALTRLDDYSWIVFTSANTVSAVWERLRALGRANPAGAARIAAVGPATGAELVERGAAIDAMPATFRGVAIADVLGRLDNQRVLLPRADIGREETAESLREAGAVVDEVVAYQTAMPESDRFGLTALRAGVDAVTFTSPSTVHNFVSLVGPESPRLLARSVVACIGPVTAAAVTDLGLGQPLQAHHSTSEGLIEILEAHFARLARRS